jgi:hypothetical protein
MIPRPLQICSYLCNPPVTGFSPAPFHSIESVDNLISIEDRDEPVHRTRGVAKPRAGRAARQGSQGGVGCRR